MTYLDSGGHRSKVKVTVGLWGSTCIHIHDVASKCIVYFLNFIFLLFRVTICLEIWKPVNVGESAKVKDGGGDVSETNHFSTIYLLLTSRLGLHQSLVDYCTCFKDLAAYEHFGRIRTDVCSILIVTREKERPFYDKHWRMCKSSCRRSY